MPDADPAPEPVQVPDPQVPPAAQPDEPDETDWKALAQKWEKRSKANATKAAQFDELTESQKTAEQKAADAAQRADRLAQQYVRAEVKSALAGVVPDPAAVVDDLNLSKFVTEDGDVDIEKVSALRAKYEALAPAGSRAPRPNPAQGSVQPARTLAEMVAEAERTGDGSRKSTQERLRLKSAQLLDVRRQQG
jgi:hypothetical protein